MKDSFARHVRYMRAGLFGGIRPGGSKEDPVSDMPLRSDGKSIPLLRGSLLYFSRWADDTFGTAWEKTLRAIAADHGVKIRFDKARRPSESAWFAEAWDSFSVIEQVMVQAGRIPGSPWKGPVIYAGAKGSEAQVCTAVLHELGHHILNRRHHAPADTLENEKRAWDIAYELANKHRLPLASEVRDSALYTYKRWDQLRQHTGSKARNPRPARPTIVRLLNSKTLAEIGTPILGRPFAGGKKGRRHLKKWVRQYTGRYQRRKSKQELAQAPI